jgi:hypothetical protein
VRLGGFAAAGLALVCASAAFGQSSETAEAVVPNASDGQAAAATQAAPAPQGPQPLVDDIQGVTLGMTSDDVKDKLGKPDSSDSTSMYYELKDGEQVQLRLNSDHKVTMVAAIYTGKSADAPDFGEVFGTEAQAAPQANGTIYKLVRYPGAGYWVSYSRLALESGPMTTVTMQKIQR